MKKAISIFALLLLGSAGGARAQSELANGIAVIVNDQVITFSDVRNHIGPAMELLRELRSSLHAGHSGAWPCRIRFTDDSTVEVGGLQSTLISEFATLVRERSGRAGSNATDWPAVISMPLNAGAETPVAVRVLRRFAG